jgi:hypothetical protein
MRGAVPRHHISDDETKSNTSPPFMIPTAAQPVQASVLGRRMDRHKEE